MRVYADTSVFGGVFDDEFSHPSKAFFEEVKNCHFLLVTSAVVQVEILRAPQKIQEFFFEVTSDAGNDSKIIILIDLIDQSAQGICIANIKKPHKYTFQYKYHVRWDVIVGRESNANPDICGV